MDIRNLKGLRIAIYARYSSDQQREASIEDQVRRCRTFVEAAGGAVDPNMVFADHAVSGASLQRPAFEKLMGLVTCKRPEVDAIVTEDLSRVTRDFADGARIFKDLQYRGIPLLGVADGIDTSARGAKMNFTMKSLLADMFLDELRDKTLRGLEGRALRGFSTGGLPFGYRSQPEKDAYQRVVGHVIEIDDDRAALVRRIFTDYLSGLSLAGIAAAFNHEGIPPARAHTAHRRKGWVAGTIRAMLHNAAYVGQWSFKRREWRKVPGTNARRPRQRPEGDVMHQQRDHLRIVPQDVWDAVQARLAEVRAHYTKHPDGTPKGRTAPGRKTNYLFSGLLLCDACGAPMVIYGGSSSRYYRCGDYTKRRTCKNHLSVKESVARACILGALLRRLGSPDGIAYARHRFAEQLGQAQRGLGAELGERRGRLARTDARIQGLVAFIADGDRSEAVVKGLRDLEASARDERAAIAALAAEGHAPIRLLSPDEVLRNVFALEERLAQDVLRGREELRRFFKGGEIRLRPEGGRLVARADFFPLMLMAPNAERPLQGLLEEACYRTSCGGRI